MPKKTASKEVKPLPCPVCGKKPEVKKDSLPDGTHAYYLTCKDSTVLGFHEIYAQAWETMIQAIGRWNDAVKSWEKRRAKNIKNAELWGD